MIDWDGLWNRIMERAVESRKKPTPDKIFQQMCDEEQGRINSVCVLRDHLLAHLRWLGYSWGEIYTFTEAKAPIRERLPR